LAEIEATFGGVRLGDGISLHQARALDDYEPEGVVAAARSFDAEERWQDITDDKLDRLSDTLAFMDAAGFRFHMPRFMVYSLTHAGTGSSSFAVDAPVYACNFRNDLKDYVPSKYALLSPEQRATIAQFLRFAAAHDDCFDGRVAAKALERYWGQYG
jgi:hypothetical protein